MRKIEKAMVTACVKNQNWHGDNTSVHYIPDIDGCEVYLHGHMIARTYRKPDRLHVDPVIETFRNWPTNTTRSRLCALGVRANIMKGRACIDGKEV